MKEVTLREILKAHDNFILSNVVEEQYTGSNLIAEINSWGDKLSDAIFGSYLDKKCYIGANDEIYEAATHRKLNIKITGKVAGSADTYREALKMRTAVMLDLRNLGGKVYKTEDSTLIDEFVLARNKINSSLREYVEGITAEIK